jgi:hypothetical protein
MRTPLDSARDYTRRGWSPVPIPFKAKRPTLKDWQKLRLTEPDIARHFRGECNVGILLGEPSGWLIDVDLDHPLAVELADQFLPATGAEFGRPGKPRSHRLYGVTAPVETLKRQTNDREMIVELRSSGCQTVFPGSIHPGGELIGWAADGEPATFAPGLLLAAVNALADEVERRLAPMPKPACAVTVSGGVIERARKYLAKIPPAVSGQGGHNTTFHAASCLVQGFAFERDTALSLLSEWNQSCVPPWTDKELAHKVDDALKLAGERGYLMNGCGEPVQQFSQAAPQAAARVAEPFIPFPIDALPQPVRGFVATGAKAIGCDASYIALPLLTGIAAAIGNTRRLRLKHSWMAAPILWCAIVGESGTAKTPAFRLALRTIRERQRKALERHAEATRAYDSELLHYEKALAEWKRDRKTNGEPPTKPEAPQAERCIVSDTTVEALAPLLLANPRGLLLARDELSGWIGSFDRYAASKGRAGADAAHWLSMHAGEPIVVDRKTGISRTIFVPQASVCVCGGIQPAILHRALGIEHRESGLAARLLLTCPPRTAKRWTEADIDPAAEAIIAQLMDRLYELQPTFSDEGELCPVVVGLSPGAKRAWKTYYNAHAQEQADLAGDLSAAWSKLEEYAARLALVVHFVRWAADEPTLASADVVDVASMSAGIRLATWFKGEVRRVYAMLGETDDDRDRCRLVEWIGREGGAVTPRDVQQGCRWLRQAGVAEAALDALANAGCGMWRDVPTTAKGGRPSRIFELSMLSTVNGTPANSDEDSGFVDVDTADAPESQADDEWGEV